MVWKSLLGRCALGAILALIAVTALTAGASAAPTCTASWIGGHDANPTTQPNNWADAGNWNSDAVPAAGASVCVETGTPVIYTGTALPSASTPFASVDVGSSGTASLTVSIAEVVHSSATTIASAGTLDLDGTYSGANAGNASLGGGPVTNLGTIVMQGAGYSATLFGTIVNKGTISVPNGGVSFCNGGNGGAGSVDNMGAINIAPATSAPSNPAGVTVDGCAFTDDTGGTIANQGSFTVKDTGSSYTQGAGSETGNAISMGQASSLAYTGAGASSINVPTSIPMTGNLAAGQQLYLDISATVTEPSSFTSAGTITLDGTYHGSGGGPAGIALTSGTFTNTGTLTAVSNAALTGAVVNDGTVTIEPDTLLELLSGSFTNAASATLAPQISSAGTGDLQLDNATTFTAAGTLAPALEGGLTATAGQEFNVVVAKGGAYSGTFATVSGGFHADYTHPAYVGAVYGAAPATTTPTTTTPTSTTPTSTTPKSTTPKASATGAVAPAVSTLGGGAGTIALKLKCAASDRSCHSYSLKATVTEHLKGRKVTRLTAVAKQRTKVVTVAAGTGTLKPGKSAALKIPLNRTGQVLLKRYGKLKVDVSITAGGKVLKHATVTITRPEVKAT